MRLSLGLGLGGAGSGSLARKLLAGENEGMAISFRDGSMVVRDLTTAVNNYNGPYSAKVTITGSLPPSPDGASFNGSNYASIANTLIPFSATVGTVIFSALAEGAHAATRVLMQIDDGTGNERFRIVRATNEAITCFVIDGNTVLASINAGPVADGSLFKVAFAWELNNVAASVNGAAAVADASATMPTVTTFQIGRSPVGEQWGSRISSAVYSPRRMTNAELVAKSAYSP